MSINMSVSEMIRKLDDEVRVVQATAGKLYEPLAALELKANQLQNLAREVDELTNVRDNLSAAVSKLIADKSELEREFAALRARLG